MPLTDSMRSPALSPALYAGILSYDVGAQSVHDVVNAVTQLRVQADLCNRKSVLIDRVVVSDLVLVLDQSVVTVGPIHCGIGVQRLPRNKGCDLLRHVKLAGLALQHDAAALDDAVLGKYACTNADHNSDQQNDANQRGNPLRRRLSSFGFLVFLGILHPILLMELSVSASFSHGGDFLSSL